MFQEIIELDREALDRDNLDYNKITTYLDKIHDVPEIQKKADGHYVGVTCSTELAQFGNAIYALQCSEWFLKIVKRWELLEDGCEPEDIIEATKRAERRYGTGLFDR